MSQSTTKYPPVTHVIFDLDGTLVDSEKYFLKAVSDTLSQYGKSMDWELRAKTIGLFLGMSAPIVVDHLGLPCTPQEFIQQVLVHFKRHVSGEVDGVGIQFLPGVKRLVAHLAAHNIPMAICTGSMKETYEYKIKPFGDYFKPGNIFHHIVIGAADPDVQQNKPYPDPYLVCIDRFTTPHEPLKPSQVLAFEDSPTGMASAIAAGCQSVFVQSNPKIDCSRFKIEPTLSLPSMEHFKPEEFGLPPFDSNCLEYSV